jgi:hypothetical protein
MRLSDADQPGRRCPVDSIVIPVLAAVLAAGCGTPATSDAGVPVPSGAAPVSTPFVDLSQRPVADDPDVAARAGAVANFIECEHGLWQGGWAPDYGFLASGPSPDEAVAALLDEGMLALPKDGFVAAGHDDGRVLYTYGVDGRAKAAIVVADSTKVTVSSADHHWGVESFASCDPAEFDASADDAFPMTVWHDADGERVPTSVITSSRGSDHCGWESVTFLTFDGQVYISDPDGVLEGSGFAAPYDDDTDLPPDASDTGYEESGRHLWLPQDRTTGYLVTDEAVEAWPSSTEDFFCA